MGSGSVKPGKRSLAEKSNDPASTRTPPIELPWPPMYLVAECTTMSAPCSKGRISHGVATVLSMINGTPTSWATSDTPPMSRKSFLGLPIDSPKNALVLGRAAALHASRSSASSTKVNSMPILASECLNRL